MFDSLFNYPAVVSRHRDAPLAYEFTHKFTDVPKRLDARAKSPNEALLGRRSNP